MRSGSEVQALTWLALPWLELTPPPNFFTVAIQQPRKIPKSIYNRIRPTGSCPPRIYGLPKIHKPQTPLRPMHYVISCIGAPSYKLSKYIASVISPLAGRTSSHVLNSKHFTGVMKEEHVEADEALVSFDVTSLFTNVPTEEAVEVIHRKLTEEEDLVERTPLSSERIAELLQLRLKSTYFSYNGEFYKQREGAAMGSPVSAVVTNLYMEFFEELALESAPSRPRFWKWYVDDTCCIIQRDAVEPLLHHLNKVRPTIKFTMELEKDGSLPFLDTSLTQREDGTLNVTVFRKHTRTGICTLTPTTQRVQRG